MKASAMRGTIDIDGALVRSTMNPSDEIATGTAVWLQVDSACCIAFHKKA